MRKKSYLEIFGNERKIKYIRFLNEYRNILLPKKYDENIYNIIKIPLYFI